VDGLLVPSVDSTFLVRCCDPISTRKEWSRLASALTGGDQNGVAEAANDLVSEISSENWERFLAARGRALEAGAVGEDQT
jgi:hypothetical protein